MVNQKYSTEQERRQARNNQKRESQRKYGNADQLKYDKKAEWTHSITRHKNTGYAAQKAWRERKRLAKLAEAETQTHAINTPQTVPLNQIPAPANAPILPVIPPAVSAESYERNRGMVSWRERYDVAIEAISLLRQISDASSIAINSQLANHAICFLCYGRLEWCGGCKPIAVATTAATATKPSPHSPSNVKKNDTEHNKNMVGSLWGGSNPRFQWKRLSVATVLSKGVVYAEGNYASAYAGFLEAAKIVGGNGCGYLSNPTVIDSKTKQDHTIDGKMWPPDGPEGVVNNMGGTIGELIKISVVTDTDRNISLVVMLDNTISDLKRLISFKTGISDSKQCLTFQKVEPKNDRTLRSLQIFYDTQLTLTLQVSRGSLPLIVKPLDRATLVMQVDPSDEIYDVKLKVWLVTGIAPHSQTILMAGKQLDETQTIEYYQFRPYSTIHIVHRLRGS